jgi:hypothetical protein
MWPNLHHAHHSHSFEKIQNHAEMHAVDNLHLMSKIGRDGKRRAAIGETLNTFNGAQVAGDI